MTSGSALPVVLAVAVTGRDAVELAVAFGGAVALSLIAAFFVSAEVALTRVARLGVDELVDPQSRGVRRLEVMAADPSRHLNMVLLLRVACEVLATLSLAVGFIDWLGFGWLSVALAAVLMILVNYVLIGVTPRILGRQFPVVVALASANIIYPMTRVLGPMAQMLVLLGRAFTPRDKGEREGPFAGEDELRRMVDLAEQRHAIDPQERRMIHSVFQLDDTSIREIMVPRTDIVFVDRDIDVAEGLSLALRSGYSRLPVVGEDEDDVVGIVYLKDMAARLHTDWPLPEHDAVRGDSDGHTIGHIMRPATYVPDSKPIDELMRDMQQQRVHVAVVIDEYGGTAGLVTIEDIVEEIVGEITDEYDTEIPPVQSLSSERARVIARLPLGELAELFDVDIGAEDVETVGGLLAYALGQVPTTGSQAVYAGLRLTAEEPPGPRSRTSTILVERLPEPVQPQSATGAETAEN
ncbi:hemolysin family protein [Salinactinospora qingdaonensis]|uniref:Hemolysin family protein n=1 Tax=Salinactinospora qingdaonensis TaxID=702744 RepID=A0ABP7G8K8_9ACTN